MKIINAFIVAAFNNSSTVFKLHLVEKMVIENDIEIPEQLYIKEYNSGNMGAITLKEAEELLNNNITYSENF